MDKLIAIVKFMGHEVEVRLVDGASPMDRAALYSAWKNVITIRVDDRSQLDIKASLFHELVELVCDTLEIKLEHEAKTILGAAFFHLMQDNDWIRDFEERLWQALKKVRVK